MTTKQSYPDDDSPRVGLIYIPARTSGRDPITLKPDYLSTLKQLRDTFAARDIEVELISLCEMVSSVLSDNEHRMLKSALTCEVPLPPTTGGHPGEFPLLAGFKKMTIQLRKVLLARDIDISLAVIRECFSVALGVTEYRKLKALLEGKEVPE